MPKSLACRRTSICLVAHTMQRAGLIRTRRGQIEILDMEGLRENACGCYAPTAMHYERLLNTGSPKRADAQIA